MVYENDPAKLAEKLKAAEAAFNPVQVREAFIELQPELFRGDRVELADFLNKVRTGDIHAQLHPSHVSIGRTARSS